MKRSFSRSYSSIRNRKFNSGYTRHHGDLEQQNSDDFADYNNMGRNRGLHKRMSAGNSHSNRSFNNSLGAVNLPKMGSSQTSFVNGGRNLSRYKIPSRSMAGYNVTPNSDEELSGPAKTFHSSRYPNIGSLGGKGTSKYGRITSFSSRRLVQNEGDEEEANNKPHNHPSRVGGFGSFRTSSSFIPNVSGMSSINKGGCNMLGNSHYTTHTSSSMKAPSSNMSSKLSLRGDSAIHSGNSDSGSSNSKLISLRLASSGNIKKQLEAVKLQVQNLSLSRNKKTASNNDSSSGLSRNLSAKLGSRSIASSSGTVAALGRLGSVKFVPARKSSSVSRIKHLPSSSRSLNSIMAPKRLSSSIKFKAF